MDKNNFIIVIDKVYRVSTKISYDLHDDIFTYGKESIVDLIKDDKIQELLKNNNYLVVDEYQNTILFGFYEYVLMLHYNYSNYHIFYLDDRDKINEISDSLYNFINSCLEDKSDESMQYLYDKLSEFAKKYIAAYDILCELTVDSKTKSARN